MDLQDLFIMATGFARTHFEADGEIQPMWIGVDHNDEQVVVVTPFHSNKEKELTIKAVRELFRDKNVIRYAFICEAWMVDVKGQNVTREDVEGIVPSRHPDRIEVINFVLEEKGASKQAYYKIIRPDDGKPYLSDLITLEDFKVEGRMSGVLTEPTQR